MKSVIVPACPGQEVREMTELAAKPKRSTVTLIWLIVSQLIALASLG
jgi:hypothetical protein